MAKSGCPLGVIAVTFRLHWNRAVVRLRFVAEALGPNIDRGSVFIGVSMIHVVHCIVHLCEASLSPLHWLNGTVRRTPSL